jgi:hypothetical protein
MFLSSMHNYKVVARGFFPIFPQFYDFGGFFPFIKICS